MYKNTSVTPYNIPFDLLNGDCDCPRDSRCISTDVDDASEDVDEK